MILGWVYLSLAVISEILFFSVIKITAHNENSGVLFLIFLPLIGVSLFLDQMAMKEGLNAVLIYTVWCGMGIILISLLGMIFWDEKLTIIGYISLALILAAITLLALFGYK